MLCASCALPAQAAIPIYGYTTAALYTISLSTGAATSVYTLSPALSNAAALAERASDGKLFYFDYNGTTAVETLYSWDPHNPTAAPVTIGTSGTYLPRLSFDLSGNLIGMDQASTHLFTVNQTTGAETQGVAITCSGCTSPNGGGDMAFDPSNNLYMVVGTNLYKLVESTGVMTLVGSIGGITNPQSIAGMAFDGSGNMILAAAKSNATSTIYKLSPPFSGTLNATTIGSAGGSLPIGDLGSVLAPDLVLTKTHTGYFIAQGPNGTYTLSVQNVGNRATSGSYSLTDTLPTGLTYVSGTGTGWSCSAAGQVVTCTSSSVINANANGNTLTITVSVSNAAIPSVTNTAQMVGGNVPVTLQSDAYASNPTYIGGLTLAKTVSTTTPKPGNTVTYTITYKNNNPSSGGTTFTNISIVDPIPTNTAYVTNSAVCNTPLGSGLTSCTPSYSSTGNGTITFAFTGSLAINASGTVTFNVTVR